MDKVVILARVSTQAQDYQRQVTERTEIVEIVEYIKGNDIQRVVCLEISRLGRNTLEALKVINYLNENGVSLYVKNYNLETLVDGKGEPSSQPYMYHPFRDCFNGTPDHQGENDQPS